MAEPLKEFLVKLGFTVDQPGLRRFVGGIKDGEKAAKDLGIAIVGMATAIEESLRRVARQFDNLFYLSQRTGTSARDISALRFAFRQVGLSVGDADSALTAFQVSLRDAPGLRSFANQLVPGFRDAGDFIAKAAERYDFLVKAFGEGSGNVVAFRRQLEVLGLSAETIRQLSANLKAARENQEFLRTTAARFGLDQDKAAKAAVLLERTWGQFWATIQIAFDKFILESFPTVNALLTRFTEWLRTEGVKSISAFTDEFAKFIQNPENIRKIADGFVAVGHAAKTVADLILGMVRGINDLNEKLGLTGTLIVGLVGLITLRAAVGALTVGITRTLASVIPGVATLGLRGGLLGGLGGFLALLLGGGALATRNLPSEDRRRTMATPAEISKWIHDWWNRRNQPGTATPPAPEEHRGFNPRGPYHPTAYRVGEDNEDILLQLKQGFANWWSGNSAFRPIVDLADGVYSKFAGALREAFAVPLTAAVPAGAGGGAGPTASAGGAMPGRGPLGRFGGAMRGGTGGGRIAGVPNIEGMTEQERNFLGLVQRYESMGGQNVMNYVGRRLGISPTAPRGFTAQGIYQLLNSNWQRIAPRLGIAATNAMAASLVDQTKVALALLRESGQQNWTRWNTKLNEAVRRGEHADTANVPSTSGSPVSQAVRGAADAIRGAADHLRGARGGLPPGQRYNSKGQPYAEHPEGSTEGERSNVKRSMDWIKHNMGHPGSWGLKNAPGINRPLGGEPSARNMNIDQDHNVTINVHGHDARNTADAVIERQDHHYALMMRNLKATIS